MSCRRRVSAAGLSWRAYGYGDGRAAAPGWQPWWAFNDRVGRRPCWAADVPGGRLYRDGSLAGGRRPCRAVGVIPVARGSLGGRRPWRTAAVAGVGHGVRRPCRATAVVAGLSLQASAVAGDGRGRRLAAALAGGDPGRRRPRRVAWPFRGVQRRWQLTATAANDHGGWGCRGRRASSAAAVR